jgi:osmoprotectant transport system permease protein
VDLLRYIQDNWDTLGPEVGTQLEVPLIAVVVASLIGVSMGIVGSRSAAADAAFTAVNSTLLTIPSFALFGLIAFYTGTGNLPVEIGLVLYALLPIQRNTSAGIGAVRDEVVDAARGMGMSARQLLTRIELPLALPVILAGLRQATVSLVAITTVGAAYNSDNLGRPILEVLRSGNRTKLLAVVLLLMVIGLSADALLAGLERLVSRGRITRLPA